MKIAFEKPDILRFAYRQESDDAEYGSCLWAYYNIDADSGILSIQSDCGSFAHRWPETGEDFIMLLSGNMTEGYLLEKLCGKPKRFNKKATIENLKEYLEDAEYYADEELNREKSKQQSRTLKTPTTNTI